MGKVWSGHLDREHDVVVLGSGAIALTAALRARSRGASVAVIEKSPYFGGTSAVSGGMVWIPGNRHMKALGIDDDREAALRYLDRLTAGRTTRPRLEAVVDRCDEMLGFVEEAGVKFRALDNFPDYHPEWDGATHGGRSLDPETFDTTPMGELAGSLRPDQRLPFTMLEYEQWRSFARFPWDELRERAARGLVARGLALVAPLVHACAEGGVTLVTEDAAKRLAYDGDRVTGVVTESGTEVGAREGVVVATGGFERSPEMVANFLTGPVEATCAPPYNTGDGIAMAAKVGAALGNMREAWWHPMSLVPGDEIDGAQTGVLLRLERTGPHSVIVNRAGRRFVNEAHNYNDMTKAFHLHDPVKYEYANLPAYLIFDQQHVERYGFLDFRAGDPVPPWLTAADSLGALAERVGIDGEELERTIERFNGHAREGRDPDFHRGESEYDGYWGDWSAPHRTLGPVEQAPYYAIEVVSGVIGTKGGIVTDPDGQALDPFGEPIAGLFAAGNTTAHPLGPGYAGAGSTLGPGMTMAYLAGGAVVGERAAAA